MQITELRVAEIHAGNNPRSVFNDESLQELATSIEQDGVLDPIRVVKNDDGYRLESGERRFRAAQLVGLETIPAIIVEGTKTEEFVRALVTNIQREDMNVVDEARGYRTLLDKHGLTPTGVAERLGVAQSRVTQRLELLELPVELIQLYYDGKLRLDCRRTFKDIALVDEELAVAVAKAVAGKDEWGAILAEDPMRVLAYVVREVAKPGRFFLLPAQFERKALKLKKAQEERAAKQDYGQYSDWRPFYDKADLDVAATVGAAYTHKDADQGVVVSREWMRDHFDVVLAAREAEIEERKAQRAKWDAEAKKSKLTAGDVAPQTPEAEERAKEFRADERQAIADGRVSARAANLELGRALMNKFAVVKTDLPLEIEKLMAAAIVGRARSELFLSGLRYVLPEYQTEEKVSAKGDRTKVVYKDGKSDAGKLFQEWFGRASKSGEFLGRALIAVLASNYADQGVLPHSGRHPAVGTYTYTPDQWDNTGQGKHIKGLPFAQILGAIAKDVVPKELLAKTPPSEKQVAAVRRKYQAAAAPAKA